MRTIFVLCWCVGLLALRLSAGELTVHEWGTFTSAVGSDGRQLAGLQLEEAALPNFVHSLAGFAPVNKGWERPVEGVTVKMETPVMYFYSAEPVNVRVEVAFHGGSISQWYPDRVAGETMPGPPDLLVSASPVNFARGYEGSAAWDVAVLPRESPAAITVPKAWETSQWPRARVAAANRIRGVNGGEMEGFIFYRGIGNLSLPLEVAARRGGEATLRNLGSDPISFVWVYGKTSAAAESRSWSGSLAAGQTRLVSGLQPGSPPFAEALGAAGLTPDEAKALLATWRESYFDAPGLRVFWIVPRPFTDRILPAKITPRPTHFERVLVGRTEVLTPEFESQLLKDFADGGKKWESSRYFLAYQERVAQLTGGDHTVAGGDVRYR